MCACKVKVLARGSRQAASHTALLLHGLIRRQPHLWGSDHHQISLPWADKAHGGEMGTSTLTRRNR